ncbi:hypothetical protein [Flavobacterium sp.]|uniref:hypothetical protein n=1 Tax=Flavobacterium sp. TaxID=239 RepID=UPI0038FC2E8C
MYSLNRITTVADCDVLLTWAEREKSDLAYKHYTINRITTNYGETSVEVEAILQGVNAEIAATEIAINSLPEGTTKEDYKKKKTRLEYKKFLLVNKKESYGSIALLERELELERINKEIAEVDVFITGVTDYKNTL